MTNKFSRKTKSKNCFCFTCDKAFHYLGIGRHRAMHRNNNEECRVSYPDGSRQVENYGKTPSEKEIPMLKYDGDSTFIIPTSSDLLSMVAGIVKVAQIPIEEFTCIWTPNRSYGHTTGCGNSWYLGYGKSIKDIKYCCHCGKLVKE